MDIGPEDHEQRNGEQPARMSPSPENDPKRCGEQRQGHQLRPEWQAESGGHEGGQREAGRQLDRGPRRTTGQVHE